MMDGKVGASYFMHLQLAVFDTGLLHICQLYVITWEERILR